MSDTDTSEKRDAKESESTVEVQEAGITGEVQAAFDLAAKEGIQPIFLAKVKLVFYLRKLPFESLANRFCLIGC